MLSTIVDDLLASEPDIVVVGRSSGGEDPLRNARDNHADMLITQDGRGGDTCLETILSGPPLSIFAIARDGTRGSAISLARQPVELGANGSATLADAIRRLAVDR